MSSPEELNELLRDGSRFGDLDDVREALVQGADVDSSDEGGKTALHMAAANGHADAIRLLLSKAADPSPRTREGGNTPLHWACLNGHAEATRALLEGGASPSALNSAERTPVDEALGGEHQDAILGVMREFAARGGGGRAGDGREEEAAEAAAEVAAKGDDSGGEGMEEGEKA